LTYFIKESEEIMAGKLTTVQGDITTIDPNQGPVVIPHVCNNIGLFGGGVSGAIEKKWPIAGQEFRSLKNPPMGYCQLFKGEQNILIANMIAQNGVRGKTPDPSRPPIRYWALANCMKYVRDQILFLQRITGKQISIVAPKFGSDLAAGNWDVITQMIQELWTDAGIDVTIYEFSSTVQSPQI